MMSPQSSTPNLRSDKTLDSKHAQEINVSWIGRIRVVMTKAGFEDTRV